MKKSIKLAAIITLIAIISVSVAALYGCQPKNEYLDEDTTFYITELNALGIPLAFALEEKQSFIKLNKDGTCTMRITPKEDLIVLANYVFKDKDLSADSIESFSAQFLVGMFPGFDLGNIDASIALLKSLNVKLVGFENGDSGYENLKRQIEGGQGIKELTLPEEIAIEANTVYNIKQLHSQYSGDYTAVYFGKYDSSYSQEPYFVFTMNTNKENKTSLVGRFEILKADLVCVAK